MGVVTSLWGCDITCGSVTSHGVCDVIFGVCDVILGCVMSQWVCDVILGVRGHFEFVTSHGRCDFIRSV